MASVTSGTLMRRKREATFGVPPAGDGWHQVRLNGETLSPNVTYAESEEIRSDGQIADVVRTDAEGGGTINGELQFGEWDDWFESSLLGSFTAAVTAVVMTAADGPAGGVPSAFTGPSDLTTSFSTGDWVQVINSAGGLNDGLFKVVFVTTTQLYVTGRALVQETGGITGVQTMPHLQNGIQLRTETIEIEDVDVTDEFRLYTGCGINGVTIEFPTTGMITTAWEIVSKIPSSQSTSNVGTPATSTDPRTTTEPMTSAQILGFYEGNTELTNITSNGLLYDVQPFKVLGATLNQTPSLRTRKAWSTIGPALEHGRGDHSVTGSVRLYYNTEGTGTGRDDSVLFDKVLGDTESAVSIVVNDALANIYVFDLPRVKFTAGTRNSPVKSQDVILEMDFQAYLNPDHVNSEPNVTGTTMMISRATFGALD